MCKIMEELWADGRMAGIQEGEAKGRMEGKLEGVMEGIVRGKLEMIRNMHSRGIDLNEALSIAGIDRKTYEEFSGSN